MRTIRGPGIRSVWRRAGRTPAVRLIRRFIVEETGPSATEYAMLLGLLVVGAMATIAALGSSLEGIYVAIDSAVEDTGL